ncbi:MAG: cytochrome C biogenesis protein, partial [Prevotella sp.]|nr:cytochrome C biogenesis protein [Prevotella sp.]
MVKKLIYTLYIIIVVSMAAATIVEQEHGTDYAHQAVYGSWWFVALWAALTAAGIFHILRRKVRSVPTLLLHLSLVVILAGALLTHITSVKGMIHLRTG